MYDLIKVANELQKVMDFEEGGPPVEGTEKALKKWVEEAVEEIDYEIDKFTDATTRILIDMQLWRGPALDEDEDEDENDPEVEVVEEVEEVDNLVDQIKAAGQMKDLKNTCKDLDEFKSIRGQLSKYKSIKELREVMLEMLEDLAAEPMKTEKIEKKPVEKKEPVVKKEVENKPVKGKIGSTKTEFGHRLTTQSGKIDEQFIGNVNKKIKLSTLMGNTGYGAARIKSHIAHLIKNRGININIETVNKELVYKYIK